MANKKPPKNSRNVNSDTNVGGIGSGNAPPGLWGTANRVEEFIKTLPAFPDDLPKNEAGVNEYLKNAGATEDQILEWQTDPNGKGPENATSWASSKGRYSAASGVESRPGDGAGEAAKSRPPLIDSPEVAEAYAQGVMRGFLEAGGQGGELRRVTAQVNADGLKMEGRLRRRVRAEEVAAGEQSADKSATEEGGNKNENTKSAPDPTTPEGRAAIQASAEEGYKKKAQAPPITLGLEQAVYRNLPNIKRAAAVIGIPTLIGMGYGAGKALFGGGNDDKPQQMLPNTPRPADGFDSMMLAPMPQAQPQAPPQTPAPPQSNPAGAPGKDQTTLLLERMLRSREYA